MKQTIPEQVKALAYLYQQSLTGQGATNAGYGKRRSGNHYFRNHFNKGGGFEGLRVITVWDENQGRRFKRYYLHPDDYEKAEAILVKHGLIKQGR